MQLEDTYERYCSGYFFIAGCCSFSVVVIRFAEKADRAGKNLEEERYSRMVAEETLQKNNAKLMTLPGIIKRRSG